MDTQEFAVYLLLGSNLPDRRSNIAKAIDLLGQRCGRLTAKSALYETAAWGKTEQPSFYNQAIILHTLCNPLELLEKILTIELEIGRQRAEKWGPRLIDIDIIFYEDRVIREGEKLLVPHPQVQHRKFVLIPLAEIAPDYRHPVTDTSVTEMLSILNDPLEVKKI